MNANALATFLDPLKAALLEIKNAVANLGKPAEMQSAPITEARLQEIEDTIANVKAEAISKTIEMSLQLDAANASLLTATAEVATLKEAAKTVAQEAATIAAAAGHKPVAIVPDGASGVKSQDELLAEFSAITDPQKRGEFYQKHFAKNFK